MRSSDSELRWAYCVSAGRGGRAATVRTPLNDGHRRAIRGVTIALVAGALLLVEVRSGPRPAEALHASAAPSTPVIAEITGEIGEVAIPPALENDDFVSRHSTRATRAGHHKRVSGWSPEMLLTKRAWALVLRCEYAGGGCQRACGD